MPLRFALASLTVAMSMGGCSTYRLAGDLADPAAASAGIIVGSITQTSDGGVVRFDDPAIFYFESVQGSERFRLQSADIHRPWHGPPNIALADHGLAHVHGKLFAVALPAGDYRLSRFAVAWPSQQTATFASPPGFTLRPGEVVYVGNLDAGFCVRHAYANQAGVAGVQLSSKDHFDRDVPLLRQRFAALRTANIVKRMLDNELLRQQSAALRRQCACERNC